jgi:hypothetical protein
MHMIKLISCLAMAALMTANCGGQSTEPSAKERVVVLQNPDFEGGTVEGWGVWAVTGDVSSAVNHSPNGRYAASPSLNVSDGPFVEGALLQELKNLSPGDEIKATVWARADALDAARTGSVSARLKVEYWDETGKIMIAAAESQPISGTSEWRELRVADRVPPKTGIVKILLHVKNEGGTGNSGAVFFDDVRLVVTK